MKNTELMRQVIASGKLEDVFLMFDSQQLIDSSDYIALKGQYNSSKSSFLKGVISHDDYFRVENRVTLALLDLLRSIDLGTKIDINIFYGDNIRWIEFDDSLKEYTDKFSIDYNNADSDYNRECILRFITQIYFDIIDNYNQSTAIKFAKLFDEKIKQQLLINSSGIDIYQTLFHVLKSGIPEIPHFYGLTSPKAADLFEKPGHLMFLSSLLFINEKGFNLKTIQYIEGLGFSQSEVTFYPLYYLIGQCYRKSNFFLEALSYFKRGVLLVEAINNKSFYDLLVLSELYRGIATVNRKKAGKIISPTEFKKIDADYIKSQNIIDAISTNFSEKTAKDTQAYNRVSSDVWFSYGYFQFEYFFNSSSVFLRANHSKAEQIISKLNNSVILNPHFTAPLSRIALLQLYCKNTHDAAVSFHSVYEADLNYLKERNDQERKFTLIWVSMAIFLLDKYTGVKFKEKILAHDIDTFIERAFNDNPSIGIIECHMNDFNVLLKIFEKVYDQPIWNDILIKSWADKYDLHYESIINIEKNDKN